ncbi:MAG TPA: PKD domain-containing protein, partial [Balneolales bacterium]|nr:PKD domain-containing protein [Balneolales bacterium]
RFNKTGNHIVWVTVQPPAGSELFVPKPVVVNRLPVQVNAVSLAVTPERVKEGQPVLLQTEFKSSIHNIRYRFYLGETPTSYTKWTSSPGIRHGYPSRGTYKVFAEIGVSVNNRVRLLTRSVTREVTVEAAPSPQTIGIKLLADRTLAYTGEEFRFTLSPSEAVLNNAIKIIFDFGDGTRTEMDPGTYVATHRYKDAGHYTVTAFIRSVPILTHVAPVPAIENTVDVQVDNVPLKVDPFNTETGKTVTFEVGFRTDDPQIRYRFVFGDNSPPTDWSSEPITTHRYTSPGSYHAYAEIAARSDTSLVPIARSSARTVTVSLKPVVTNPPDNPFSEAWIYVILLLVAASAIYYRMRTYHSARQMQVEPRVDKGEQSVSDGKKLALNYEIRCNPNYKNGDYKLTASQPHLIQNIRRKK